MRKNVFKGTGAFIVTHIIVTGICMLLVGYGFFFKLQPLFLSVYRSGNLFLLFLYILLNSLPISLIYFLFSCLWAKLLKIENEIRALIIVLVIGEFMLLAGWLLITSLMLPGDQLAGFLEIFINAPAGWVLNRVNFYDRKALVTALLYILPPIAHVSGIYVSSRLSRKKNG